MELQINSLHDVTLDGQPAGTVVDVLFHAAATGDESLRGPILDGLIALEKIALQSAQGDRENALATAAQAALEETGRQLTAQEAAWTAKMQEADGKLLTTELQAAQDAQNIANLTAERDALAASSVQRQADDDDRAKCAKVQLLAVQGAFEILGGILSPLYEREAAAKAARKQQLLDEAAQL